VERAASSRAMSTGCAAALPNDDGGMVDHGRPFRARFLSSDVPSAEPLRELRADPSGQARPQLQARPRHSSGRDTRKPARATVGESKFEGGEVPKAKAALDKLASGRQVRERARWSAHIEGMIDVSFLVRAQGIAEGVDIHEAQGSIPTRRSVFATRSRRRRWSTVE